ncbi:hypothetical protein GJ496_010076 [Pomphorhynchus laevis]|nr:hypothetical protein GJ496_010076 [Pomphorhynchus laevis]
MPKFDQIITHWMINKQIFTENELKLVMAKVCPDDIVIPCRQLIQKINKIIKPYNFRIEQYYEDSGDDDVERYSIIYNGLLALNPKYSYYDPKLVKRFSELVSEIIYSPNSAALIADKEELKFLSPLIVNQYLRLIDNTSKPDTRLTLTNKAIIELSSYILTQYPADVVHKCPLCSELVLEHAKCNSCQQWYHTKCLNAYQSIHRSKKCPQCTINQISTIIE